MAAIDEHHISPIDVVVVNLYPFRQTVTAEQSPSYETAVENIDIGASHIQLPQMLVHTLPRNLVTCPWSAWYPAADMKPTLCEAHTDTKLVRCYETFCTQRKSKCIREGAVNIRGELSVTCMDTELPDTDACLPGHVVVSQGASCG